MLHRSNIARTHRSQVAMSVQTRPQRLSITAIKRRKGGEKLVCLTAYTAPVARLLDDAVDLLLVGDSVAMVVYGFDSTLPVTLDMMIAHGAAVVRATSHAAVVVDLPFGSYQAVPGRRIPRRRPRHGRDRLPRGQARRRRGDGRDGRLPHPARDSGDGPCRADAAIGQSARRLSLARPPGRGAPQDPRGWRCDRRCRRVLAGGRRS